MEFRILGEVEVRRDAEPLPLRGAIQRAVLALLLLRAKEPVQLEELVDGLWGAVAPETAAKMVQNAVSQLRKLFGPDELLETRAGGYLLRVEPEQIDAHRFEQAVAEARRRLEGGAPKAAVDLLREGDALWRGLPLADVAQHEFAPLAIAHLEDLRLAGIELRIEAELALGRHAELVAELEPLAAQHPLRETLRLQLMLALYRSGRQAEALAVYQSARRHLTEEFGIEPSPALQRLERAILLQDPALEPPATVEAPLAEQPPVRKTVTVLYVHLERRGARLDPEAFRAMTALVEQRLAAAIAAHGALVEIAPNGSLVGVFGVPSLAEDDALRASRAAVDVRRALPGLNELLEPEWRIRLSARMGICTGETLVEGGTARTTGQVVDLAEQLAHAAGDGDVLLAAATERLARGEVRTQATGELELGGESQPVWLLLDVPAEAEAVSRRLDAPLVGRDWELAQLARAFERTVRSETSHLVTILGPAGIGKSRLATEFVGSVRLDATVLSGRCLPYGTGVTFWPLAELVLAAAGATSREAVRALVADGPDADHIADLVADALGAGEPAGSAAELFWAVRKLFSALARRQPLVLLLDDIHWAEPTLLDLLDHIVETTRDAPVLLLCLARPELLEARPTWSGGKLNAVAISLEPLLPTEAERVIENAGGGGMSGETVARIATAAEGNPLFLEQMVALALEQPAADAGPTVPPTIQALLAARIDRLGAGERAVLHRAAIIGKEFWRGAVVDLSPEEERDAVGQRLEALSRRELIGAAASQVAGDEGYRFRHGLIRDVVYEEIPKRERAELHERFAHHLERTPAHLSPVPDEILGYHLEQAYRYQAELGPPDDAAQALAKRAAELLARAGRRAYARDDVPGAVGLLTRAADLLREDDPDRLGLLPDLGEAVRESGDYARGELVLAEAIDAAAAAGDRGLEAYARLVRLRMRVQTDPDLGAGSLLAEARAAIDVFTELGDDRRLAKAWELLAWGRWIRCQAAATEEALQQALAHARSGGDSRTEAQSLHLILGATLFGPLPVTEGIARCEAILAERRSQKRVMASAFRALAALKAMTGEFREARVLLEGFAAVVDDLGLRVTAASAAETYGVVELLAGDPIAAERELRLGHERLEAMGETSTSVNLAALLAQALHAQGRDEEAVAVTDGAPAEDDVSAQVHLFSARAKALGHVGRLAEAERLARDAVALAETTDFLVMWGDALSDLAEVLCVAGRPDEAAPPLQDALRLYERKGSVVAAARARALLPAS